MIGITGATGQLGREVLSYLGKFKPGGERIVACTRHPETAHLPANFVDEIRRADFADTRTLADAFAGVTTLLMISVEGNDEDRIRLHSNAVDAAHRAGVERIVYTSFFDIDPASPSAVARVHRLTEECVMASGCSWTLLRNGPYIDNVARRIAETSLTDGPFRMAAGTARLPFIARSDLAEAAACALTSREPGNHAYRLSGPELLSYDELAALIGNAIGKPLAYLPVSDDEYRQQLREEGLPPELEARRIAYSQAMRAGFMTALTDDFARLVGRAPLRIADVLRTMALPD
ncbi:MULTISPECIES: SDR family oxidoreductase [Paraburkholderia]|uniref:SDR family oxidoreductase n=1 Tax=Paraburkholderia dipogonis TaxID=1211383 RepID=A0A4Y8MGW7_9BURK|nr:MULTISPECIES: SDR family oxidoreductase [Paraburkholderia]RKR31371.1 NAD(P)H dehydrogenase (quinone) [Paraburkholderia sp. BL17N1]TFE36669.1 SDR family oxidoreductase [Paraburkholderia dipogonis]